MGSRTFATDDLRALTDGQLIHRLNGALIAREEAHAAPSRAARLLRALRLRGPVLPMMIDLAVLIRDAAHGCLLAMALASPQRIAVWAERSRSRMEMLAVDIAILRMIREMERRIPAHRQIDDGRRPVASR
jgi:hypothetical protein